MTTIAGIPEWTPVAKSVRIGDTQASLHEDGSVTIHNHARLIGSELTRLTRSDIDDLLVALDSVSNDARDPNPETWKDQISREALTLSRNVYAWTASKATVELTVAPDVFHTIAADCSPFRGDAAWEVQNGLIRFYDGSVNVRRGTPR